jgi:hypothetical protein
MKLLISRFIIDAVSWFFSNFPKMTFTFTLTGTTTILYVTFNLVAKSVEKNNIVKFFMTSPCNLNLDISSTGNVYFNPNTDCTSASVYAFYTSMPSYTRYGAANATQVTFVVQVRAPPDIT